mgnify:CR=1 FL=1
MSDSRPEVSDSAASQSRNPEADTSDRGSGFVQAAEAEPALSAASSAEARTPTPLLPGAPVRVRKKRRSRRKRASWLRRALFAIGVIAVAGALYGVVVGIRIAQASAHLQRARAAIERAETAVRDRDLDSARLDLAKASDEFVRSRNRLASLEIKVVRRFPLVGPNLKVAYALSIAGAKVADAGGVLLQKARVLEGPDGKLRVPYERGRIDLEKLGDLAPAASKAVEDVRSGLATVEASPSSQLVPVVAEARSEFLRKVSALERGLDVAAKYLEIAPELLGKQSSKRYLVAIGNNAEMNAQGMVLAYGILDVRDGTLVWSKFGSVTELQVAAPVSVPLDPDFRARWAWANPDFAWQRTNVSADTQTAGTLMAALYASKTGLPVDGVIYIDGIAIGYLLEGTGPLSFDDPKVTLDSRNFADFTMNKAYFHFANQSERKEFLVEAAARAVAAALEVRGSGVTKLVDATGRAVTERRLWIWTSDTELQSRLATLPLGGMPLADRGDVASYALLNLGGNKVDYYVRNTIRHRVTVDTGGRAKVAVEFKIENTAPADLPEYVGGAVGPGQAERGRGEYLGYLTWYAPNGSRIVGDARPPLQTSVPDAGFAAFSWSVKIPPGSSQTIAFEYELPDDVLERDSPTGALTRYKLTYIPQPRFWADRFETELVLPAGVTGKVQAAYSASEANRVNYSDIPNAPVEFEAQFELKR